MLRMKIGSARLGSDEMRAADGARGRSMNDRLRSVVRSILAAVCVVVMAAAAPPTLAGAPAHQEATDENSEALKRARFFSVRELLGVQESVFETLFLQPWDEENWEYPLDGPVAGPGLYTGTNHLGQQFDFDVKMYSPVDLAQVALTPEQRQWAADNEFEIAAAIADLGRDGVLILVHGSVVSTRRADGTMYRRFWLANTLPAVGPYPWDPIPEVPEPRGARMPSARERRCLANEGERDGECAHCDTALNNSLNDAEEDCRDAIEAARQQRQNKVAEAEATLQRRLDDIRDEYLNDIGEIAITLTACLVPCLFAGGPFCGALCSAAHAALFLHATYRAISASQSAKNDFSAAVLSANDDFEILENAALTNRDNAINRAYRNYSDCLGGCGGTGPGGSGPPRFLGLDEADRVPIGPPDRR